MIRLSSACSCNAGSASRAAASSGSPGMKATTNSGERSSCFQYSFLASWSMWVRSCLACFSSSARRASSSSASMYWRNASSGTLESITTWPPPGRWTIMSGRSVPVVADHRLLLLEVAVLEHPGRLDGAPQRHLAPATTRVRRAQRRDQVAGLLLQLLVAEVQRRHPLAQTGVGALALDLHQLDAPLVAGERLAQRRQHLLDRLLALRQVALRRRACLAQARVGQGEELLVVLRQRLPRQRGERARQAFQVLLGPRRGLRPGVGGSDRARPAPRPGPARPPSPRADSAWSCTDCSVMVSFASARRASARRASLEARAPRARCQPRPISTPAASPMSTPMIIGPG